MEQKAQLLDRILTLRDYSPFILICDSLAQTAHYFIEELEYRKDQKREVVYIKDLNQQTNIAQLIQSKIKPNVSVIGVYHTDSQLAPPHSYEPSPQALLEYMATSIVRVIPQEKALQRLADYPATGIFDFSGKLYNQPVFEVQVEHRRKTGRSLTGKFIVDAHSHTTKFVAPQMGQDDDIPTDLTTFNLTLTEKQKRERENVELPFLEAQQGPEAGGAIVYQFEKDDDWDEEDPYEDPF